MLAYAMFLAGIFFISTSIFVLNRVHSKTPSKPAQEKLPRQKYREAEEFCEEVMHNFKTHAEHVLDRLETRERRLMTLAGELEKKIQILEKKFQEKEQLQDSDRLNHSEIALQTTEKVVPRSPKKDEGVQKESETKYQKAYRLFQDGHTPEEIARTLDLGKAEVRLLIGMRRRGERK